MPVCGKQNPHPRQWRVRAEERYMWPTGLVCCGRRSHLDLAGLFGVRLPALDVRLGVFCPFRIISRLGLGLRLLVGHEGPGLLLDRNYPNMPPVTESCRGWRHPLVDHPPAAFPVVPPICNLEA